MRYASPYRPRATDDVPTQFDGDDSWLAVNMEQDRSTLQRGVAALSINKRLRTGKPIDRDGTLTPVWANQNRTGGILGSGVYSNPNGAEVILIATPTQVELRSYGNFPTFVPIPTGTTLSGSIEFGQDFNQIFLMGSPGGTLVWDGVSASGFVPISKNNPDPTLALTPNVPWSVDLSNRRIFPISSPTAVADTIGATLIGDYTDYDPILGVFRVNAGTADSIIGAYPFGQGYLIVGKSRSMDVLINFFGDLSQAQMTVLSTEIGIAARRTAKMIGGDLIFLSNKGVFRTSQVPLQTASVTTQPLTALQVNALPVGATQSQDGRIIDPIAPLIRRINWNYVANAVAAFLPPYYYLAVPIDSSTWNNAIFVYNSVTDSWEGYDTWADSTWRIDNLLVTTFQSVPYVYAVNSNTNTLHVLYEGRFDTTNNGDFEIQSQFETRGYAQLGHDGTPQQDALQVQIALSTWRPSVTITMITEQAFDGRVLNPTPITRNRTKYITWGKPDYVPSNINNDFNTPGREDYSLSLSNQPLYAGTISQGGSGFVGVQLQEHVYPFALKGWSRWKSFRIVNTQGRADLTGIMFEARGKHRRALRRFG